MSEMRAFSENIACARKILARLSVQPLRLRDVWKLAAGQGLHTQNGRGLLRSLRADRQRSTPLQGPHLKKHHFLSLAIDLLKLVPIERAYSTIFLKNDNSKKLSFFFLFLFF